MLKRRILTIISAIMLLSVLLVSPAMADGTKVVTIGADLSDEQEAFIINYFGADLKSCEVIYVHNWEERQYLGASVPIEQIGNITISSAYVQPTSSGGIQVKTANLTYVTGNMIASVMSTAGVKNCNVVAAAPFPVSGTGALTGVMIAYQKATGKELPEEKRDLAIKEFVVTQQAAESIGENEALQMVNAVKMEVISSEVDANDTAAIEDIVNNIEQTIINDNRTSNVDNSTTNIDNSTTSIDNSTTNYYQGLSEEDRQLIIDLAKEIAEQQYNYEDVKDTLERVEDNLSSETNISIVIDNSNDNTNEVNNTNDVDNSNDINNENSQDLNADISSENTLTEDEDSILSNTNDEIIDPIYQSSTRDEDIEAIEEAQQQAEEVEVIDPYAGMYQMDEVEYSYTDQFDDGAGNEVYIEDQNVVEIIPENNEDYYGYEVDESDDAFRDEEPVYIDPFDGMNEDVYSYEDPYTEPYEEITEPDNEDNWAGEEIPEADEETVKTAITAELRKTDDTEKTEYDHVVKLFVEQKDFVPVSGTMTITDEFGTVQYEADLSKTELAVPVEMTEDDLEDFGWTEGTELDIFLEQKTFDPYMTVNIYAESEDSYAETSGTLADKRNSVYLDAATADDLTESKSVHVNAEFDEMVSYVEFEIKDTDIAQLEEAENVTIFTEGFPIQQSMITLLKPGTTELTAHYYDADGNEIGEGVKIILTVMEDLNK